MQAKSILLVSLIIFCVFLMKGNTQLYQSHGFLENEKKNGELTRQQNERESMISHIKTEGEIRLNKYIHLQSQKMEHSKKNFQIIENDLENENGLQEINTKQRTSRLLANAAPTANFNIGTISGYTVFAKSASSDIDGTIASTSWDWGDSTPLDSALSVSHIYTLVGTYTISLTVTDNLGATSIKTATVTVPSILPVAQFTFSKNKQVVFFNATSSSSKYGVINNYKWDFGDGIIETYSVPTVTHSYSSSNTYTAVLTVTDDHNAKGSKSNKFSVIVNIPPTASFNVVNVIDNTVNVQSTSTDKDGIVVSQQWNWGDESPNDANPSSSHIYAADGVYTITLTVVDDSGAVSSQTTTTVTVPSSLPIADFTPTVQKLAVSFDASSSFTPYGSITSYKWNFGDGNAQTSQSATMSHTFISAGQYLVTLELTNDQNLKDTYSQRVTTVANVAPSSGFSYTLSDHTVTVTSASTDSDGTVSEYQWNFGDGTPNGTNAATTTHTYATGGNFNISHSVIDNQNLASKVIRQSILINDAPVAIFTLSNIDLRVKVDGSKSTDDNGVNSYTWNWGDDTLPSTGSFSSHAYTTAGTYQITLTVSDAQGLTNSFTQAVTLTAPNTPPVAAFTLTTSALTVSVNAGTSKDDNGIALYSWNWGDSSSVDNGVSGSHTYASAGTYTIKLTVSDAQGLTNTVGKIVTVTGPNAPPVAAFTFSASSLTLTVDGKTSTDDKGIASYSWNWGDLSSSSSGSFATHTYAAAGTYQVTLKVSDSLGLTNSIIKSVTVAAPNSAPSAAFTITTNALTVNVNGGASKDDNGIASYSWNWGDSLALDTGVTASHSYASAGTYMIKLTVSDAQGLTSTTSKSVTVSAPNAPPVAAFTYTMSLQSITVDGRTSTDDKGISSYSWNWGDSTSPSNGRQANHSYAAAGSYQVTLTVTDTQGLKNTASQTVVVALQGKV